MVDNSTRFTAKLIEAFLKKAYPEIHEVRHIDSKQNLFRFDANIVFVKNKLLPLVDGYRSYPFGYGKIKLFCIFSYRRV